MEIARKISELHSSKEYEIVNEMKSFEESLFILHTNYYELNYYFEDFKRTALKVFPKEHPTKNVNIETKRLIHNYLSSVITIIDHSRVYINKLHPENSFEEYQIKMKSTFVDVQMCSFVKELRQYMQHYKLPEISFQKNALSIKQYALININKEELLKFSGWKKESKKYINSSGNSVDLRKVLKDYQSIVYVFYDWLLKRQKEIFEKEILKVEELKNEINFLKLKNIQQNIFDSNYKTFKDCENDVYQLISTEYCKKILKLNEFERITEIVEIFKVDKITKYILKDRLESILI